MNKGINIQDKARHQEQKKELNTCINKTATQEPIKFEQKKEAEVQKSKEDEKAIQCISNNSKHQNKPEIENALPLKSNITCYTCGGNQNLIEYDEQDAICRACYEEQTKMMLEFKKARTSKYPEIDFIGDGVFLGNEDAATTEELLKQRNISAICACGAHLDTPFKDNPSYVYKIYEIQDFPKQIIKHHFGDHHSWMNKMRSENRNILVHCAAGVSRSASFVIAYFMKEKKMPFHEALQFVRSKRKWIHPNSGFRAQLIKYNSELGLPADPNMFFKEEEAL